MKLIVPPSELKDALAGLSKVVNVRAPVPILGCARLDAEDQAVRLTGTSIDQTAKYELQALEPVPAPVSVLIPLAELQAVMKTAQGPDIEIEPGVPPLALRGWRAMGVRATMGAPMVFHTTPPQPASKARWHWYAVLEGGADATQNGFGDLMPARLMDKSAIIKHGGLG